MALWIRLRQSKLNFHIFTSVHKRFFTVNHGTILANEHIIPHTENRASGQPDLAVPGGLLGPLGVRFYAKPAQSFQKKEDDDPSGPRLNEQITAPMVRLVSDEGHCVVSRYEAMTRARNLKMDLVEVDRHAKPPVCKIFDFHKEKYEKNDLKMKAESVKRLMESGYRVKCTAIDPTEGCDLPTLLSRFTALIKDVAVEESDPKVEKKQAFVVVRHIKFGPLKKGPGKNKNPPSSQNEDSQPDKNGPETAPVGPDNILNRDAGPKKSWAVFDRDDDINTIFDINEESFVLEQPAVLNVPLSSSSAAGINQTGNRYARDPTAGKPPKANNTGPQMSPNLPRESFRQDSFRPNISTPQNKSYGIFSTPKVNITPNEQNPQADNNRYKKSIPPGSGRNPTGNPRMNRGPGAAPSYLRFSLRLSSQINYNSIGCSLVRSLVTMDFDEIEYLENTVENPELKKDKSNGDDMMLDSKEKGRARSSKHASDDDDADDLDRSSKPSRSRKESDDRGKYRSDDDGDDFERRSKQSRSRRESDDHEKGKRSRNGSSKGEKERHSGGREHRTRDREDGSGKERNRDRDRDRDMEKDSDRKREGNRDRREREHDRERNREEERERSKRSRSHLERQHDERGREKRGDMGSMDKDSREGRREREFRGRDHESRKYKEKKEDAVESAADPERDQRTVFAYQITLKAGERDVYEFFSRVGKVRDVQLIMDRNTRRSKGVGYIEFYDAMSVPMAIALSGQPLLGQPVMVKPSEAEKNLVQPTPATAGGGVGPHSAGARKLYVGNLPVTIKEDQLRQVFEPFGTIELIQMPTDPGTSYCKGFAFIQFARLEDAKLAQNLNGQLQIAGRQIKVVSAVTDQAGMQDTGVNVADFDDDEGNGMSLNAHSRALLMQKLDRTGTASSIIGSSAVPVVGQTSVAVLPGLAAAGLSMPIPNAPSVDTVGVPSECLLLKNMFDPSVETEPDFDLDIKEDCQEECAKYGKLKHIYVEKNSAGFVYLRFEQTQSAFSAQQGLHGRWFAGKMITATFMSPQDYEAKFPDSS
ncbi:Splicing factor- CC1-like [Striga hermonthica]|uniref:Splicing factor- CC1-like n=1 Tax=Striga hermonthica TaxID=68872 RepID=A0A9N7MHU3_STRHE|nr:Splicing factor- CC1-like [Striga hermonthica]